MKLFIRLFNAKYTYFLLLIIVNISLLSGCENLTSIFPNNQTHPDYLNKFLTNPTCMPPCWENITPGITNPDEAIMLLKRVPEINEVEITQGKLPYSDE